MINRAQAGQPAVITFTSDFHELVTGDLRPERPVTFRYDPRRIIPRDEPCRLGDLKRPIMAHVQFGQRQPATSQTLTSPVGMIEHPVHDPTGQRFALMARFDIPADAEEVIVWFSYQALSGEMYYDSDYGANYHFSFVSNHLEVAAATVVSDPQTASSRFAVTVATDDKIDAVAVRYLAVSDPTFGKDESSLQPTGQRDAQGRRLWAVTDLPAPPQATVRFKIYYWLGGQCYKDDNAGHYYLAPPPAPVKAPPPPAELARAAQAWRS